MIRGAGFVGCCTVMHWRGAVVTPLGTASMTPLRRINTELAATTSDVQAKTVDAETGCRLAETPPSNTCMTVLHLQLHCAPVPKLLFSNTAEHGTEPATPRMVPLLAPENVTDTL